MENILTESILESIKSLLGVGKEQTGFDREITTYINGALSTANMLGVGPSKGFRISGYTEIWSDLLGEREDLEFVKTYIYLKVLLKFDPPQGGYLVELIKTQITEDEWRIVNQIETPAGETGDI